MLDVRPKESSGLLQVYHIVNVKGGLALSGGGKFALFLGRNSCKSDRA